MSHQQAAVEVDSTQYQFYMYSTRELTKFWCCGRSEQLGVLLTLLLFDLQEKSFKSCLIQHSFYQYAHKDNPAGVMAKNTYTGQSSAIMCFVFVVFKKMKISGDTITNTSFHETSLQNISSRKQHLLLNLCLYSFSQVHLHKDRI